MADEVKVSEVESPEMTRDELLANFVLLLKTREAVQAKRLEAEAAANEAEVMMNEFEGQDEDSIPPERAIKLVIKTLQVQVITTEYNRARKSYRDDCIELIKNLKP